MLGADLHDLDLVGRVRAEAVHAYYGALAALDPPLLPVGLGDAPLHPARLDDGDGPAGLIDVGQDVQRLLLDPVRERLEVAGAAQRVRDRRHPRTRGR
jgi:hypothetical protein